MDRDRNNDGELIDGHALRLALRLSYEQRWRLWERMTMFLRQAMPKENWEIVRKLRQSGW